MRAMILAAGRGERMRPLTDHTPKPLLLAGGKPLIVWHIERLVAAGISDIVVNCAWLAERLQNALGNGSRLGARLQWSREETALETAGGIARALPLLGSEPFLVVNGDTWCDWDTSLAAQRAEEMTQRDAQAWLLLVNNPGHNPQGDFVLQSDGRVRNRRPEVSALTFSGIGIYDPSLFDGISGTQPAALAPLLRQAMERGTVIGNRHDGEWMDIGTPERLQHLDTRLRGESGPVECALVKLPPGNPS